MTTTLGKEREVFAASCDFLDGPAHTGFSDILDSWIFDGTVNEHFSRGDGDLR